MRRAAMTMVLLGVAAMAGAQPRPDAELAKGIAQVQDGYLDDAVATLNGVVRRLSPQAERREDLAQAYLWFGIAYAQLDSEKSGRASFREALRLDPRVSLAEGWPPKVSRLFAAVKAEAGPASSPEATAIHEKADAFIAAGRPADAEATYRDSFARNPKSAEACTRLAEVLLRPLWRGASRFDEGMAVFEGCLPLDQSGTPEASHQTLVTLYWDKLLKDSTLTNEQKNRYADRGLDHANRALAIKPNLIDSIAYKGLLLRMKASVTKDPRKQKAYLEEATQLQKQATDLRQSGKGELSGAYIPPPGPPPTPPAGVSGRPEDGIDVEGGVVGGLVGGLPPPPPPPPPGAVRVGGQIKAPRQTKRVEPVYPSIAQQARVQGVVIMECTISPEGKAVDVKVLRSIPLLDQAAIDAARQWEYTPTLLNGVPVPVITTVTMNFKLSVPSPAPQSR